MATDETNASLLPRVVCGVNATCFMSPEAVGKYDHSSTVLVACMTLTAMVSFALSALVHRANVTWLPEPLVTMLLGAVLGCVLFKLPDTLGREDELNMTDVEMIFGQFLNLALPVIIFEAGWTLRRRDFASQLGYILLLAIVGTLVTVVVVTCLILVSSSWHGVGDIRTAVAYAALISSVDPVATLSTFGRLNVDPLLFILVFGESQINDAVAITLFEAVNERGLDDIPGLLGHMAGTLFGSIGLGFGLGIVYIFVLRFAKMRHSPTCAVLFVLCSSIFTYSLGELLTKSGIITVLFNSIFMGAYSGAHLSPECMGFVSFMIKQLSTFMDTHIFMFCGVSTVFFVLAQGLGATFGILICLFCLVGRAAAVLPLGVLSNGVKLLVSKHLPAERRHMISGSHLFMLWHSGLRGGVSLVLALRLGPWVNEGRPGMKTMLVNATFMMIAVYLLAFGSTTALCLRLLGLPLGDQVPDDVMLYTENDKHGIGWRFLKFVRQHILGPLLVGSSDQEPSEEHVMEAAVRQAEADSSVDISVPANISQLLRKNSTSVSCARFDLFGTTDPTLHEDVHRLRRAVSKVVAHKEAVVTPTHISSELHARQVSADSVSRVQNHRSHDTLDL